MARNKRIKAYLGQRRCAIRRWLSTSKNFRRGRNSFKIGRTSDSVGDEAI
jgi:hypothetical protein